MLSCDSSYLFVVLFLQQSKNDNIGLKQKLCFLEEDFTTRNKIHEEELEQTRQDLLTTIQVLYIET